MRFNNHELAILARQESSRFEKEGFLFMKLKQEKLFKKGEGNCLLRLNCISFQLFINKYSYTNSYAYIYLKLLSN